MTDDPPVANRYEREYGTDWRALDPDEATERAYAIGVAERLGQYNREELQRIYEEMTSAYTKSMVELAYDEGRTEAKEAAAAYEAGDAIWEELVEGETEIEPPESPTGGRDGLPEALDPSEILDRQSVDSTEAIDRPEFLEK